MKKVYFKPEMTVVAVDQQHPLLGGGSQTSTGPSADFMSNPTISSGAAVKQEHYNVWNDDWSE
jgi:hypothetical protein